MLAYYKQCDHQSRVNGSVSTIVTTKIIINKTKKWKK